MSTHQTIGQGFLSWWGRELRDCLPTRLATLLFGTTDTLELAVSGNVVAVGLRGANGLCPLGHVDLDPEDPRATAAGLRTLLGRRTIRRVTLRLSRARALETEVDLPVEAADNLHEALAFELDAVTPFPAGDAAFDYAVTDSDADLERLRVRLLVARREDVAEVVQRARALGLRPDRVTGPADADSAPDGFNLLAEDERPHPSRIVPRATAALTVTALALAAVTLVMWIDRQTDEIARLDARATALRTEAGVANALRDRAERLAAIATEVATRKQREPMAIAVLDELSRVLPDSDWLTGWSIRDDRLELSGYSADPSAMLRRVEGADLLDRARFTSPLTMDRQQGKERFSLEATVVAAPVSQ